MIAPRPSSTHSTPKPGYPMSPFFGIDPLLVDDNVSVLKYTEVYSVFLFT